MTKIAVYTSTGSKKDSMSLPKTFDVDSNLPLIAQAVRVFEDRSHQGTSKVKTRSDVQISTRKIYRQKGTGYARHGAKSAPIFVGGGIAHGPKGIKRSLKISKKMAKKALLSLLNLYAGKNMLLAVDGLGDIKKTKEASKLLSTIRNDIGSFKSVVALSEKNLESAVSFRNIPGVNVKSFSNLSVWDVINANFAILDSEVFKINENVKEKETIKNAKNATIKAKTTKKAVKKPTKTVKPKSVKKTSKK